MRTLTPSTDERLIIGGDDADGQAPHARRQALRYADPGLMRVDGLAGARRVFRGLGGGREVAVRRTTHKVPVGNRGSALATAGRLRSGQGFASLYDRRRHRGDVAA